METRKITSRPKPSIFDPGLLLRHREILRLLTMRQFILRYKQMKLGALWAVLAPASQLVILWFVFGVLIKMSADEYAYLPFVFCGLVPWWFFVYSSSVVASSIQDNMPIVSKIYFPKALLPMASLVKEFVDSGIIVLMCILVAALHGLYPGPQILLLPLAYVYVVIPAFGLGILTACLSLTIKDVRPIFDFGMQLGFYLTPLLYSWKIIPGYLLPIYQLNPMYWGVELFRLAILGRPLEINIWFFVASTLSLAILLLGLFTFARFESRFIDEQ